MWLGEDLRITHKGAKADVNEALDAQLQTMLENDKGDEPKKLPQFNKEFGQVLTDVSILPNPIKLSVAHQRALRSALRRYRRGDRTLTTLEKLGIRGRTIVAKSQTMRPPDRLRKRPSIGAPIVEMNGVQVKYGDRVVLGDWDAELELRRTSRGGCFLLDHQKAEGARQGLHWSVRRGQRWAILGPNG